MPAYIHAYFHSFPSICFSFLGGCGRKRGEIERPMRNVQRAFTPLPASGYTCTAAGDSPRSSIINVHRVSQVEALEIDLFGRVSRREGQVHEILAERDRAHPSVNMSAVNVSEVPNVRRNFTSVKPVSTSTSEDRSILEFHRVAVD